MEDELPRFTVERPLNDELPRFIDDPEERPNELLLRDELPLNELLRLNPPPRLELPLRDEPPLRWALASET